MSLSSMKQRYYFWENFKDEYSKVMTKYTCIEPPEERIIDELNHNHWNNTF